MSSWALLGRQMDPMHTCMQDYQVVNSLYLTLLIVGPISKSTHIFIDFHRKKSSVNF